MKSTFNKKEYEEYINSIEWDWVNSKYPWYEKIWDNIKELFDYIKYYGILKRFYQKITRGWDDSETWDLDSTFFKWIYPRLKRFKELNNGYPDRYEKFEEWDKELEKRIEQLRRIIEIDEYNFPYHEYLTKEDIDMINKYHGFDKIIDQKIYNSYAYNSCRRDFLEWFKNNINDLWW